MVIIGPWAKAYCQTPSNISQGLSHVTYFYPGPPTGQGSWAEKVKVAQMHAEVGWRQWSTESQPGTNAC